MEGTQDDLEIYYIARLLDLHPRLLHMLDDILEEWQPKNLCEVIFCIEQFVRGGSRSLAFDDRGEEGEEKEGREDCEVRSSERDIQYRIDNLEPDVENLMGKQGRKNKTDKLKKKKNKQSRKNKKLLWNENRNTESGLFSV